MTGKIFFHSPAEKRSESCAVPSQDFRLREFEARVQSLSDRLPSFGADVEVVWLKSGPHIFDPALDLRVKVDAVRWMLRVAKHSAGTAREQILMTVKNSLDQLEEAVDPRLHAA
jgi:hypothetical protein